MAAARRCAAGIGGSGHVSPLQMTAGPDRARPDGSFQQSGIPGDILVFIAFTAVLSAVFYSLALVSSTAVGGDEGRGMRLYITGLMWSPGVAALLTAWLRGLDVRAFGWGLGAMKWNWVGYLLPLGYSGIAYLLVWLAGWGYFADPANVTKIAAVFGWPDAGRGVVIVGFVLVSGTTGMVSSLSTALGEEIGWRGFLAPRVVERAGFTGGVLLVGTIWALWHLPLILFGSYNQGAPAWITVLCFTVLVFSLSVVSIWLRLRSHSLWPSTILHASHNLFIQAVLTPLTGVKGPVTSYAIGEFGLCVPAMAAAAALYFWMRRGEAMAAWRPPLHRIHS